MLTYIEFHLYYVDEDPNCQDELPSDWKPDVELTDGVSCGLLTCNLLTSDPTTCEFPFTQFPFSNCVETTTGLVKEFCKKSCTSCGKL